MDTKSIIVVLLAVLIVFQVVQIFYVDHRHPSPPVNRPPRVQVDVPAGSASKTLEPSHEQQPDGSPINVTVEVFTSSDLIVDLHSVSQELRLLRELVANNTAVWNHSTNVHCLGQFDSMIANYKIELFDGIIQFVRERIVDAISQLEEPKRTSIKEAFSDYKTQIREVAAAIASTKSDILQIVVEQASCCGAVLYPDVRESLTVIIYAPTAASLSLIDAISATHSMFPKSKILVSTSESTLSLLDVPSFEYVQIFPRRSLHRMVMAVQTPFTLVLFGATSFAGDSKLHLDEAMKILWDENNCPVTRTQRHDRVAAVGFQSLDSHLVSSCAHMTVENWTLSVQMQSSKSNSWQQEANLRPSLAKCGLITGSFLAVSTYLQEAITASDIPQRKTGVTALSAAQELHRHALQPWAEVLALQIALQMRNFSLFQTPFVSLQQVANTREIGGNCEIAGFSSQGEPSATWQDVLGTPLNSGLEQRRVAGSETARQIQLVAVGQVVRNRSAFNNAPTRITVFFFEHRRWASDRQLFGTRDDNA